jgi:phospholipid/cholesterol/gamma-HCH transport system substrate-binding protein
VVLVKRALAAVAGLFVALSLAGCGGSGTTSVDAIFKQIGDLPRFANVQSSDVVIGSVRGIRLDGYNARVTLRINSSARIPRNALALIRSTSLLGEEFVELRAPASPATEPLENGDVIPLDRTSRVPGLDDALIGLGRLLEGGTTADLTTIIHSSATIVRNKGEELGQVFTELRRISGTLADRAPDVATAIDNLDGAISTFADSSDVIERALASTADSTGILVQQQADLDRLVAALDRTSSILARYTHATRKTTDRTVQDLTLVLDKVMTTTGDLDKALSSLAQFTDLWPRAFPGDYLQLDIVFNLTNAFPPSASSAATNAPVARIERRSSLNDLLWGPMR